MIFLPPPANCCLLLQRQRGVKNAMFRPKRPYSRAAMTINPRPQRRSVLMLIALIVFLAPILARAAFYAIGNDPRSWRDADWSSTGMLPAAGDFTPARIVFFTGTAGAWKGVFSVHSWIVLKRANEKRWTAL